MSLTNSQYDIILHDYENRQLNNRHELERKKAYVYEHIPGYRDLEDAVAAVSVSQGKKYLEGDENAWKTYVINAELSGKISFY